MVLPGVVRSSCIFERTHDFDGNLVEFSRLWRIRIEETSCHQNQISLEYPSSAAVRGNDAKQPHSQSLIIRVDKKLNERELLII